MKRRIIIDGMKIEGAEAKRIIDEAVQEARIARRARHALALFALLLVTIIVTIFSGWLIWVALSALVGRTFPLGIWLLGMSALTAIIVGVLYHSLMEPFHRQEVRAAMARRGFEICSACGYWLKGLREDSKRCPECGAERPQTKQSEEEQ
jgi:predicted RNA-binding Zn-ribbon protein involved in translation (DUF1610 family)